MTLHLPEVEQLLSDGDVGDVRSPQHVIADASRRREARHNGRSGWVAD